MLQIQLQLLLQIIDRLKLFDWANFRQQRTLQVLAIEVSCPIQNMDFDLVLILAEGWIGANVHCGAVALSL